MWVYDTEAGCNCVSPFPHEEENKIIKTRIRYRHVPTGTTRRSMGLGLAQRLRRWTGIEPAWGYVVLRRYSEFIHTRDSGVCYKLSALIFI